MLSQPPINAALIARYFDGPPATPSRRSARRKLFQGGPDDQFLDIGVDRLTVFGDVTQIQFADRAQPLDARNLLRGEEVVTRPQRRNNVHRADAGKREIEPCPLGQHRPCVAVIVQQRLSISRLRITPGTRRNIRLSTEAGWPAAGVFCADECCRMWVVRGHPPSRPRTGCRSDSAAVGCAPSHPGRGSRR